ncbi:MAG: tetratricopeptide repeat protein [Planctomycetota bacterium]
MSRFARSFGIAVPLALLLAVQAAAEPASIEAVRQALRERAYGEADQLASQRITSHPQEVEARYLRALALFHLGKIEQARVDARWIVEEQPTSRYAHKALFLEAELLSRQREFAAAVTLLQSEAGRLLSPARKREVCSVILRFADALSRERDPDDPADLGGTPLDYPKAYALYSKALELEIDDATREEVLYKRALAAEHMNPWQAVQEYQGYLASFDPTWGEAPGRERRPSGAHRWEAREHLLRALLAARHIPTALRFAEDLLRLLATPAGQGAPAELPATASWLRLQALQLPTTPSHLLPLAVRAMDEFLARFPAHPAAVAVAYLRGLTLEVHGRHDEAIAAFEDFLAGKGFRLPAGEAAQAKSPFLGRSPAEQLEHTTREAVYRIGHIRQAQRRFADAIATFEDYVRRFPNGPHWSACHAAIREAQLQRCLEEVAAKRYDEARKRFDQFLLAHPLDGRAPRVLFLLGQMLVAEGEEQLERKQAAPARLRFEQAIAAWGRLVSKYPGTEEAALALYRTGLLEEERLDQLEEALKTYRKVTWGSAAQLARQRIELLTREQLEVVTERVFRSDEQPLVKVKTRNLEKLSVRQYFLDLEGYFRKHHESGGVERLDIALIQPDASFEVQVAGYKKYAPLEQEVSVPFKANQAGVCLLHVAGGDFEATVLVVRSDVELVFRASREELLAFAQDVRLGQPASDVEVLVSDGEKVFLSGKTGRDGVLRAKHERLGQAGGLRVFAQRGGHVAASQLDLGGLQGAVKLAPRGYLYADRSAYQPGQTIHARGVVRAVEGGSFQLPKAKAYKVRLLDQRGAVVDEEAVEVSPFGTFCASFALDAQVPVGRYRIVAVPAEGQEGPHASHDVLVQQFELRPVELALEAPRTVYQRGEVVELTATARFAWGQPAAGKQVVVRLPDGREERGQTDEQGRFRCSFDTTGRAPGAAVPFVAALPEEGVQAVLNVFLPALGFQITVTPSQPLVLAGEPVEVAVETRGPDGEPVGRRLTLQVLRRETPRPDPVLAQVPWFEAPHPASAARQVQEQALETDPKTGRARASIKLEQGGAYVLRVSGQDRFQQPVVAEGTLEVSDQDDATRLRIISPEATLQVGAAHTVQLHSRMKAPSLALITWEGDAIIAHRVVRLAPGTTPLKLEVGHEHFPNFRLAVTALEGRELRSAQKDFKVERELRVSVKPKQERYAPGAEGEVELTVTDQLGRPVRAELSLALVDETLFARFPEQTEPIARAFSGGPRRAEFRVTASNAFQYAGKTQRILEAFKQEAERLADAEREGKELKDLDLALKEESEALGRGAGGRMRRDAAKGMAPRPSAAPEQAFDGAARAPMAEPAPGGMTFAADDKAGEGAPADQPRKDELGAGFWRCSIVTDDQGQATVRLPLPTRTTRWRLTSRGVTVETLAGEATAQVITAKDFFVELLVPRHLREGDALRLIGRVHGKAEQDVQLELEAREGERLLAARRQVARIGASGTVEVVLPELVVPARTGVELVLRGRAGGAVDAVSRALSVLPWGEEVAAYGGGTASGDASVSLRLPAGELRSRWLSVLVGPTLEGTLAELALQPGCGWPESLGGRILGLASVLAQAKGARLDTTTRARLEAALRQALAAAGPRQQGRGWGVAGPDLIETCLMVWGLAKAREVSSFVPDARGAERWLQEVYRGSRDKRQQASILFALAEAGQPDFRLANSLYRARNELDPLSAAQLALVFKALDRVPVARELLRLLPRKPVGNPAVDAFQLLALARIEPGTPAEGELAAALLRGRGTSRMPVPAYHGLVVAALAAHFGEGEPASDDARITVYLDGTAIKTIARRGGDGAVSFEVEDEQLGKRDQVVLRFRLEGRGRYAYSATLRGFRPGYAERGERHWRVLRRDYLHARLRHAGKEIGVDSSSPVRHAELGQQVEVSVHLDARARDEAGLVLIEPLPAGAALVPGSLKGSFVYHEQQDGELRLYYPRGRYLGQVSYSLVGRIPGRYRIPPTRLVDEQDPSRVGAGAVAELDVLGSGERSPDVYQLNDGERYALGTLSFQEGDYARALTHLLPLFERQRRPNERELARMILWIHTEAAHYDARRIVAAFEVLAVRYPELEVPFDRILVVGKAYADLGEHERAMLVFRATIDASFLSDSQIASVLADQGQELGAVDFQEALWWHYPDSAQVAASLFATSQRLYELAPEARRLAKEPRLPLPGVEGERKPPTRVSLLARAIETLRAFLAHHPQSPLADDAAFSLANAFLDLKRYQDVVTLTQRSLTVYPDSDFAGSFRYMTALGCFWERNYAQALQHALVVAEGKTRFHTIGKYILGQIYHAESKPADAIKWYETVKDQFPDAREAIDYFQHRELALPEVTVVRPGQPAQVEVRSRNLKDARLLVYKVDLMKLYLREKDLSKITQVELAGIAPQQSLTLELGSPTDYADKKVTASLSLKDEGAYLLIARGDDLFASGLVLITPLELEVQEEPSGRVRVNVTDQVKQLRPANVHVKAVGSADGALKGGETDLRGVFVADGLRGKATVIAREGEARYAFYRGETWLGAPPQARRHVQQAAPAPAVDYEGYLRQQNRAMQERSRSDWDEKRRNAKRGVQVQQAR